MPIGATSRGTPPRARGRKLIPSEFDKERPMDMTLIIGAIVLALVAVAIGISRRRSLPPPPGGGSDMRTWM